MWVKIDDRFFHNPKIRRAGKDGRELYLAGLTYTNGELTDGFIHKDDVAYIASWAEVTAVEETTAKLAELHLWEPVVNGYMVHDYHDYNPTKEQLLATRQARAEAGSMGGQRSAESKRQAKGAANLEAPSEAQFNPVPVPVPVPGPHPVPESSVAPAGAPGLQGKDPDADKLARVFNHDESAYVLATRLQERILARDRRSKVGHFTEGQLQGWAKHMDRLIRLDHRAPFDIERVIDWCQQDSFWCSNILSAATLREKYETLLGQMANERHRTNGRRRPWENNRGQPERGVAADQDTEPKPIEDICTA